MPYKVAFAFGGYLDESSVLCETLAEMRQVAKDYCQIGEWETKSYLNAITAKALKSAYPYCIVYKQEKGATQIRRIEISYVPESMRHEFEECYEEEKYGES